MFPNNHTYRILSFMKRQNRQILLPPILFSVILILFVLFNLYILLVYLDYHNNWGLYVFNIWSLLTFIKLSTISIILNVVFLIITLFLFIKGMFKELPIWYYILFVINYSVSAILYYILVMVIKEL